MKNFIYFENIDFLEIIKYEIEKTIAKFVLNKISKKKQYFKSYYQINFIYHYINVKINF